NPGDGLGHLLDGAVVGDGPEAARRTGVALVGAEQTVGVRALQVALDALGAEHAAVEGEVLPRLEADDLIALHLQLDAALLAAEAAVRLHQPVRLNRRRCTVADGVSAVWPEPVDDVQGGGR